MVVIKSFNVEGMFRGCRIMLAPVTTPSHTLIFDNMAGLIVNNCLLFFINNLRRVVISNAMSD